MLQKSNTEAMVKSCLAFVNNDVEAGRDGEEYLQILAANNNGVDSIAAASILADVYFLDTRSEVSRLSCLYNKIAGQFYQQSGDIELASHYYNQYLARAHQVASHYGDDFIEATSFLLSNNTLFCTERFLALLQQMADASPGTKLANDLMRLHSRAENRVIYLELDKQGARRNLEAAVAKLKAGNLFSATNHDEIQPPAERVTIGVSR